MYRQRLILVDDHPIVLAGLCDLLRQMDKYEILATGQSAEEALHLAARHKPDLIVMDLHMRGDVMAAIAQLSARDHGPAVIVFSASDSVADCEAAMSHGAQAYVVKGASGTEIFHALDVVARGDDYVSSELAARMMREMRRTRSSRTEDVRLSVREEQIVRHLMDGASNKAIAERLRLSEKTVKHYMTHIMQKFSVENRLQVVVAAQSRARA